MAEYTTDNEKPGSEIALQIVNQIAKHKIRDWTTNQDAINKMRGEIVYILNRDGITDSMAQIICKDEGKEL